MKTYYVVIIGMMLLAVFSGCHKNQNLLKEPTVTETSRDIVSSTVVFNWTVDWPGKLVSVVELSENEDMSISQTYGSENETENHSFKVTVMGLNACTRYYYRYVVWNRYNEDKKYKTEIESFVTNTDVPKVKTLEITYVTHNTATVSAEVIDENGATVTERGVCWDTDQTPTTSGNHTTSGNGTGAYSIPLLGLQPRHTYYVRAYAVNENGIAYGDTLSFTTDDAIKPVVTTLEVTNIEWRTASVSGEVTDDGGLPETERGICWSTSHNPELSGDHVSNGTGAGNFTVDVTGLTVGTIYFVRAYAKNSVGVSYGDELSFETKAPESPTVTTSLVTSISSKSAIGNGVVTTNGGMTLTEYGFFYGISPNPATTGTKLVATSIDAGSFTCLMDDLDEETTYYVCAYATNSMGTSYGDEVSFVTLLDGIVNGVFSVSSSVQVYFSRGNLQYRASDGTWRFAERQYDCVGADNGNISSTYNGWIDLFCWGTSGWNSGVNCYQPWSTSTNATDYLIGGTESFDMIENYANADWGVYNAISNGSNEAGQWRTLTRDEWCYVLEGREASTLNGTENARYAKANVVNVNGMIVFPDIYVHPIGVIKPMGINQGVGNTGWIDNVYSASDWMKMEAAGAVFLPAAGERNGTSVNNVNSKGYYMSATRSNDMVNLICFEGAYLISAVWEYYYWGHSVRLVRSAR